MTLKDDECLESLLRLLIGFPVQEAVSEHPGDDLLY